ncbi:MAG TPA: hypothetical protein VN581_01540 [Patescibacteria group bacterium]|nr:hypothetical protein [Patescibacteria group bacterium]
MSGEQLCATLRWLESARCALARCEEAGHDREAAALAIVLRAAIHAKNEAMRAHMRAKLAACDAAQETIA